MKRIICWALQTVVILSFRMPVFYSCVHFPRSFWKIFSAGWYIPPLGPEAYLRGSAISWNHLKRSWIQISPKAQSSPFSPRPANHKWPVSAPAHGPYRARLFLPRLPHPEAVYQTLSPLRGQLKVTFVYTAPSFSSLLTQQMTWFPV